jgi:hypothetical protein
MSEPSLNNRDDTDLSLPSELAAAIKRARQRTASTSTVQTFTARILERTPETATQVDHRSIRASGKAPVYWICAVAASIGLILSLRSWVTDPLERADVPAVELLMQPVYSSITTVSLTQVSYRQVEEDLDRADAQIEEASESLALASLRSDIQATLEKFYDWSTEP